MLPLLPVYDALGKDWGCDWDGPCCDSPAGRCVSICHYSWCCCGDTTGKPGGGAGHHCGYDAGVVVIREGVGCDCACLSWGISTVTNKKAAGKLAEYNIEW